MTLVVKLAQRLALKLLDMLELSGPISRDVAILSLRYPISRYFSREVSSPLKRCHILPLHLVSHRRTKEFCALSLQVSHDMKSIAAGPLSAFGCSRGAKNIIAETFTSP